MSPNIKKVMVHGIPMSEIMDGEQLESLLREAQEGQQYVLFKIINPITHETGRESLFKIICSSNSDITLKHYDLTAFPMLPNMKAEIEKNFPHVKIDDICRRERESAVYTKAAYAANQDIRNAENRDERLDIALRKLEQPAFNLVNKSSIATAGMFSTRTTSGQQVDKANKLSKNKNKPTF